MRTSWQTRMTDWILNAADSAATRLDPPDVGAFKKAAILYAGAAGAAYALLRSLRADSVLEGHARALGALRQMITSQGERIGEATEEARRSSEAIRARVAGVEVAHKALYQLVEERMALPQDGETLEAYRRRCPHAHMIAVVPVNCPDAAVWIVDRREWSVPCNVQIGMSQPHEHAPDPIASPEIARLAHYLRSSGEIDRLNQNPRDAAWIVDVAIRRAERERFPRQPVALGQQRVSRCGKVATIEAQHSNLDQYLIAVLPLGVGYRETLYLTSAEIEREYPIVLKGKVAPILSGIH